MLINTKKESNAVDNRCVSIQLSSKSENFKMSVFVCELFKFTQQQTNN